MERDLNICKEACYDIQELQVIRQILRRPYIRKRKIAKNSNDENDSTDDGNDDDTTFGGGGDKNAYNQTEHSNNPGISHFLCEVGFDNVTQDEDHGS